MNHLNPKERELVALGAAMGSNCVPCIEYHIPEARKAGLSDRQIRGAIRLADKVRQVPARMVLGAAVRMLPQAPGEAQTDHEGSGSGQAVPATGAEAPCCT